MVKLAILWHMHQPNYEDLATGEHILPWVRLHAIKDYWGMVALLDEFPGVHVTFNLVPALVAQVQSYAEDRARDRHLQRGLAPADDLSPDDAASLVANGFHAPYGRMIGAYPRYAELHAMRERRSAFGIDDLRDLQVWHKLAWMDPDLLAEDSRLRDLIEKGSGFTEGDKAMLRAVELDILGRVVPAYRAAAARGQVELSTSPFYHPILPLLCDSDIDQRARPGAPRPRLRFARPDDAREQIERAVVFHEQVFGQRPTGMWPSEGSVSDEALGLMAASGIEWAATDEDILARSIETALPRDSAGHAERADLLYRPYRAGANGPVLLFRDHTLSDRIGFTYQSWGASEAAGDFVERVREAGRRFATSSAGGDATVTVILDGENAWEHFAGGGRPFLRALYGQLQAADDIRCVTMSDAAATPATTLPSVFPGSWICSDFYVWIGHADDHRAWTQLGEAREAFDTAVGATPLARARAYEELLVAEGSDWFWWYGDDHSSDHDRDFDDLFRRHLRNAYTALGIPVPGELYMSNITTGPAAATDHLHLGEFLSPTLDGRESSGLEWMGAAHPSLDGPAGAMHKASDGLVTDVRIGCDASTLFIRLAGDRLARLMASGDAVLAVIVSSPTGRRVEPERLAVDRLVEVAVPFVDLGAGPGDVLTVGVEIRDRSGAELVWMTPGWTLRVPAFGRSEWGV